MRRVAFLAFFLSGASSLIFQSIWTRLLHHVFGATSVAMSTVVTAFMAGLGLGAFLAGRHAHKIKNPLRAYALVELGVGIYALALPYIVDSEGFLAGINAWLRASLGAESFGFMAARFAVVFPFLLIPTTLMGSSLPLLARHFVRESDDPDAVGVWVGALYSVNTIGAVFGVAMSVFALMPSIGLMATSLTAAGMNFGLAALIFIVQRGGWDRAPRDEDVESSAEGGSTSTPDNAEEAPEPPLREIPAYAKKIAMVSFAVSGAAALCYEVVWSRALAMTNGSSVYGFGIILTTFLVGIGGGSAIASGLVGGARRRVTSALWLAFALLLFTATNFGAFSDSAWVEDALTLGPLSIPGGALSWALVALLTATPLLVVHLVARRYEAEGKLGSGSTFGSLALLIPTLVAISSAMRLKGPAYGRYPQIVLAVVICVVLLAIALMTLRRLAVLQLAVVQALIGLATLVNMIYQDDVNCALGAMVADLEYLPDHIGTVRFFNLLTSSLCTLPSTLGMGAMFPLTLRLYTRGGEHVADDVGRVYASNTLGSIVGAWVPGFVLMPRYGMQAALFVGMVLNFGMALVLLIAAAADPDSGADGEDDQEEREERDGQQDQKGSEPKTESAAPDSDRPPSPESTIESVLIYLMAPILPALIALLYAGLFADRAPAFVHRLGLRWDASRMTLGVFRPSVAAHACEQVDNTHVELVYYRDGWSTTVTVERYWGTHLAMKNNGKVDASNGEDMPTQINMAAYPLLMHENGPEGLDVAIIGFGSGVSVGAALQYPVRSVDVIELERAIPEAARWFAPVSHLDFNREEFPFVEMDRLRVINDDGRNYLAATEREYDVILSEPSNPWITGVSDLFTEEHFRISKQRLREGGIYCQWVQLYELSPENIKIIYRTFASQFEHVMALSADDFSPDTILLGSDSPLPLDLARVSRAFETPGVRDDLERATLHRPHDFFARILLADREEMLQYTQLEHRRDSEGSEWEAHPESSNARECEAPLCRREPVPTNTDDNMRIEFAAPRDLIGYERYKDYLPDHLYSLDWPYGDVRERMIGVGEGDEAARNYAELSLAMMASGRRAAAADLMAESARNGSVREGVEAARVIGYLLSPEDEPHIRIGRPSPDRELSALQVRQVTEGYDAVRAAVDARDWSRALDVMEDIPSQLRQRSGPSMRLLHAYLLYKTSREHPRYDEVITLLEELSGTHPRWFQTRPEIQYFLAKSLYAEASLGDAVRVMRNFVRIQIDRAAQEAADQAAAEAAASDSEGDAGGSGTTER